MPPKSDDPTAPGSDISRKQLSRLLAADYLISIADEIRKGVISGFDFAWDERYEKPIGTILMSATSISSPLERKILRQVEDLERQAAKKIYVEDISEKVKGHSCNDDSCIVCADPDDKS